MEKTLSQAINTQKVWNKNKLLRTDINCQDLTNPVPPLNLLPWVAPGSLGATESTFQFLSTFGTTDPKAAKVFAAIFALCVTD